MVETTQQYIARITGYVVGKDHLKVLQVTSKKLAGLVKKATKKKLTQRPAPDKWSIAEILAHLAESEIVFAFRLRLVLGASGAQIQAFDQNVWQDNAGYLNKDAQEALRLFESIRASNIALLKSLSKAQWENYGMHQERGKETVSRIVEMFAGHDINHTLQVEGIVNGTRK
ncbi:MAG TPA: DinB family protein [Bacteroidota bacterium]